MSELVPMLQPQKFTTVAQQPSRTLALTPDALRCSTSEARAKARAFVHFKGRMHIGYFDGFSTMAPFPSGRLDAFCLSRGVFGVMCGFAHTVGGADFPYPKETLNHD